MSKLSENLKKLIEEQQLNTSELARLTDIGQPVIYRMISGETDNPKVATLGPIARYFGISISQLIGDAPLPQERLVGTHQTPVHGWHKVPVLSWKQSISWPIINQDDIGEYIDTTTEMGKNAFALKIKDSTMTPKFVEGTTVIFDPDITPEDRDYVLAHIDDQPEPTFKQILFDSNDIYLKPLNPDFKTIYLDKNTPHKMLGVLAEARMDFKRR